jgi:hypothetical protein
LPQVSKLLLQCRYHFALHRLSEIERSLSGWAVANIAWLDYWRTARQDFLDSSYSVLENGFLWQFCQIQAEGDSKNRV